MTGAGAPRAIVLGGGVAGLAAAFGLADRGLRVTVLEAHGWLGGRAFSFRDRASGRWLDNGPHLMLGCYRAMRALLRQLGTESEFARGRALSLAYRAPDGRGARLQLAALPVPLALPAALGQLPCGLGAKLRALGGMAAVLRGAPASWTVADWLRRRGQDGEPAAYLWRPMCRAIMNAEPQHAAARLFLATLRQAFAGGAAAAAFWVPRRPWGELVGEAALRRLRERGVEVRLGARVVGLAAAAGAIARVVLGDGSELGVDRPTLVVSALPWHALARLLPALRLPALAGSPLVSVHFDVAKAEEAPPDDGPLTVLVDGDPFHFLYRTPDAPRGQFTLLAGGNLELDGLSVAEIERRARVQLARHCPSWKPGTPAQVRVAKESRATFRAEPALDGLRPRPGRLAGGPANLLVCGDWTGSGLPATLEGAARSAETMLRALA